MLSMDTSVLPNRKEEDVTSMKCNVWFLRFLDKFRNGRESWQQIAIRLITQRKLNSEESKKLNQEIKNYRKFL